MKLLVFLVVAAFAASSEAIINGQIWTNAPYVARIFFQNMGGVGGLAAAGSIITDRHILTSASVIQPQFAVVNVFIGGVTRASQIQVVIIARRTHIGFISNPRQNDIGMLVTGAAMIFSNNVRPIALPALGSFLPYDNEQGTALGFSGWPQIISENLLAAFMRIVTPARCNLRYNFLQPIFQFCAEDDHVRSDICGQDAGGPFIILQRGQEILAGISTVDVCQGNPGIPIEPSLFTRVSAYSDWIAQQIKIPV